MEWVETTGRSVQEAKDRALDELGVDEADAEFEVVSEAQTGLFGRLRSEARVRARVRPTAPRAKDERRGRDRRRRSGGGSGGSGDGGDGGNGNGGHGGAGNGGGGGSGSRSGRTGSAGPEATARGTREAATPRPAGGPRPGSADQGAEDEGGGAGGSNRRRRNRHRGGNRPGSVPSERERASAEEYGDDRPATKGPEVEVDMDRQGQVAADFLTKLTAEFGLNASVTVARPDEDTVEIQLGGSDLGILIGPKGTTLLAIQNLTRTVVFNETGGSNGHINVDVGGYRQKRTEALVRFAQQVADQVKSSGNRTVLEPMSAVDRKVVHDTISGIDGVSTISEGEEPRRRVVVLPG